MPDPQEEKKMTRIYRAQSVCHEYLIPTALRCHNFLWLEKEFPVTRGIDLSVTSRDKSSLPKPESHPDERSIKAYYLSLRNIIQTIHHNPIFKNFALLDQDWYDLFKDFHNNSNRDIQNSIDNLDGFFCGNKSEFNDFDVSNASFIQKLPFLKLSHHFQHFNLNFENLPYIGEPPHKESQICDKKRDAFPTMCLDFSDDIDVMREFQFINDNSAVYSIDVDAVPQFMYDFYNRKYNYKLNTGTLIGSNTNKLMKLQNGYCVYWPWKYTIDELKKNKMFDFKVEHTPGKTFLVHCNITWTVRIAMKRAKSRWHKTAHRKSLKGD
jgi:hypothetical protein